MSIVKLNKSDEHFLHAFLQKGPTRFLFNLPLSDADKSNYLLECLSSSLVSDQSVLISSPSQGVIIQLECLPWDTEVLQVPTARIQIFQKDCHGECSWKEQTRVIDMVLDEARQRGVKFLSAKVPSDEIRWLNTLEDKSFRIKDSELVLMHNRIRLNPEERYAPVYSIHQQTVTGLDRLAVLFSRSRFANDEHFREDVIQKMWRTSLENCCIDFADRVFLAKKDARPIGILALKRQEIGTENVYSIYLMGVEDSFQRKNIGTTLVSKALEYIEDSSQYLIVETQTHNYSALKFYQKVGFNHVVESRICMHCWL